MANKSLDYVYTLAYPGSMGGYVFYVGKGRRDRITVHEREARNNVKSRKCSVIRKIWRKGEQVVKEKIAFFDDSPEEAALYEVALIFFMRPYGHLTNEADGGDGAIGVSPSAEARQKKSIASTHYWSSEENRRAQRERLRGRIIISSQQRQEISRRMKEQWEDEEYRKQRMGHLVSETTRQKISNAHTGRKHTEQARQHMSEAQQGPRKPLSSQTRQKISEALKTSPRAIASRKRISESQRGQKRSEASRKRMSEVRKGKRLPSISGEKNYAAKLTFAQVQEARELRLKGWTFAALAKRYGVAYATIREAVVGITWKGFQEDGTDSTV